MSPSPTAFIRATLAFMRAHYFKACAHDPLDLRREVGGLWTCGVCSASVRALLPDQANEIHKDTEEYRHEKGPRRAGFGICSGVSRPAEMNHRDDHVADGQAEPDVEERPKFRDESHATPFARFTLPQAYRAKGED